MVLFLMSVAGVSASDDVNYTADNELLSAGVSDDAAGLSCEDNVISSDNRDWYVNASAADEGDGSNSVPYNNFRSVLYNSPLRDEECTIFLENMNADPELSVAVDSQEMDYGSNTIILLDYNANATGKVNITLTGDEYNYSFEDIALNASITLPEMILPDNYNITVSYSGDETFTNATANATVIINKLKPELSVEDSVIDYGEIITIILHYNDNATGLTNIYFRGEKYGGDAWYEPLNNTVIIELSLLPDVYNVAVEYFGNQIFESATANATLIINKLDSELSVEAPAIFYGEDIVLYLDYNENATGMVDIGIAGSGGFIIALNQTLNGTLTFVDTLDPGDYIVSVYYHGDDIFNETNIMDVNLTINKVDIAPEINLNDTIMTVNVSNDALGNITLTLGNNTLISKINDGIAEFNLSEIPDGDYDANLTYPGDDIYNGFEEIVPVSIKSDFNIMAENLTKYYGGSEAFLVEVINVKGQPLRGKNVQITINGVTYNRITNESGIARLNINLNTGQYPASASLENKTVNATVTVLSTVNGTDITKVYRDGTTYNATFLDGKGNFLENGTAVKFNINGVIYNANVSGDSGLAQLNVDLPAGEYIVTATNPVTGENTANNITMIKVDSNISVEAHNVSYSEWNGIIADIFLPGDATGNVSVTIGNDTSVYDINSSEHEIIEDKTVLFIRKGSLDVGEYIISATYEGNEYYNSSGDKAVFNVLKADYNITINTFDINVTDVNAAVALIRLPGDARGNVSVSINDDDFTIEINATTVRGINGALLMPVYNKAYPAGDYNISAVYGSDSYEQSSANGTFKVSKVSCTSNVTVNDTNVTVEVPEDAEGNITLSIGNGTIVSPIENGTSSFDLGDVPSGEYNATLIYGGDDIYNGFEIVCPISIEDKFIITAENLTKYYGGSERFSVNLTDRQGNPIADAVVGITLNGLGYVRVTDENGSASIAVNLNSGEYPVVVSYDGTSVNATVTVLTTVNGTDVVKVFRNATQYYATFLDSEGKFLANGTDVQFNINGVLYDRKVSGNEGLARLNINLEQGEYIITAINTVTGENTANNITVLPKIIENSDITKYYRNATQYTVKLIGDDGKAVGANVTVKFNINGVFYERTTNESGIAKLNINLQPGDYIITAEYDGCRVSNNITVLQVLSAGNMTKKYGTPDQFVATLVDGQGKPYSDQNVTFNINGVFYSKTTDSEGQAKLNINLMPGEYVITSTYNEANIANKVTVTG